MKRFARFVKKPFVASVLVLGMVLAAFGLACGGETVIQTVVVEREVEVPGAPVVQTVVVERSVPGETVIQTVVVEKEVEKIVVATPTAIAMAMMEAPAPQSAADTAEMAVQNRVGLTLTGLNSTGAPDGPWSIAEGFFQPGGPVGSNIVDPVLAETWEVAEDLSKITVTIKEGVQFHRGWGELTADDLVWSFNDLITPESTHNQSGDYAAVFEPMVKIDDYTVEVPIKQFTVVWNQAYFNTFAGTNGTFSKKAFDENGREWVNENVIATGPYMLKEFIPQNIVRLESNPEHHIQPAYTPFLNVNEVPEESTRIAMLRNGQTDIADVS